MAGKTHNDDKTEDKAGDKGAENKPGGLLGEKTHDDPREDQHFGAERDKARDEHDHREDDHRADKDGTAQGDEASQLPAGSTGELGAPTSSLGATAAPQPSKKRSIEAESKEDELEPMELLDKIRAAKMVEVVFEHDGEEIAQLPAMAITGDSAWAIKEGVVALTAPMQVGPLPVAVTIDGYGLFLDGELVAYQRRFEPIDIPAGRIQGLTNDVLF
jgi:hypothetical protein